MGRASIRFAVFTALALLIMQVAAANAATISLVPSSAIVNPGGNVSVDVVVDGIPQDGLDSVQFRLNTDQTSNIVSVPDLSQAAANSISIALPLQMSSATGTSSGLGDFFLGGAGTNGVLAIDNQTLLNGSALFTYGETYGATLPSGGGSVARFMIHVGDSVAAQSFRLYLTDVMLLNSGNVYPLTDNEGTTIQVGCVATVPDLTGMTLADAQAALGAAELSVGKIYEIQNDGTKPMGRVLQQSLAAGSKVICNSSVDLAINTAPKGSIVINNGVSSTDFSFVNLSLSASDAGSSVTQMEISNDSSFGSAAWVPFTANAVWNLTSGGGQKTVYVRFEDALGNVSNTYSASINVMPVDETTDTGGTGLGVSLANGIFTMDTIFHYGEPGLTYSSGAVYGQRNTASWTTSQIDLGQALPVIITPQTTATSNLSITYEISYKSDSTDSWSSWQPLTQSPITLRYFQLKADITSSNPSVVGQISQFEIMVSSYPSN